MAPEFKRFAEIGAALMKLHIEYEKQAEYPLKQREGGLERGFAAWVDFLFLVDGVVPGLEARPTAEKLPSGVKTP